MKNNSQKYYKSMLGGISKKLAYRLLKNNLINFTKIGREYKIAKVDVILYLTEKDSS